MNNQVLIVGSRKTKKLTIAKKIFHASKLDHYASHSGIIITGLPVETRYYKAEVRLFIDEVSESKFAGYQEWFEQFQDTDMKELRDSIGGLIITVDMKCLDNDLSKFSEQLEQITGQMDDEFLEGSEDDKKFQWEGFKVVIGVKNGEYAIAEAQMSDIEYSILAAGFLFISVNENNEGLEQLVSVIENNQWPSMERKSITKPQIKIEDNSQELGILLERIRRAKLLASSIDDKERKETYAKTAMEELMKDL
ncbi:hypothetical protein FOA43_003436 [Brettanomyces nanus]|uniref:Increased recombination centers protein 6 n=1 Tax=Eeniella nana TaxID=13502 RepID=A0A875RQ72_EENNA|nr:uncharacterized protein FOA43_003436 [Brettanomyces nanus]QPG76050.1 hypothetical protein FOA43_003436 [Brettanomyces nanus]